MQPKEYVIDGFLFGTTLTKIYDIMRLQGCVHNIFTRGLTIHMLGGTTTFPPSYI